MSRKDVLLSRLYIIRRLQSHLNKKSIFKLVDGLFTSKLRYGLQLYGKVRAKDSDSECADLKAIQMIQNSLLRTLNGTKIKDMISTKSLLKKFNMLSINQMNAQVKLLEIWKSMNIDDYPLIIDQQGANEAGVSTRGDYKRKPIEIGKTNLSQKTCISDAIRIWNQAPDSVTNSLTVTQAKNEIKKYVTSLPT